ncbi:cytochrome P450 [Actinoplanes sichuanensis]|uniref:Cytochrome P450 n=1 Tax=Actinoplanes sichuanensis TaxID=512349 RepID=A0ABW4AJD9_9ACTN|nr:cytochrome P450 [Actinoplanes sichuanensis]BEL12254.1 cytochrome P450 [Actinoplanes sichuanensis]
MTTVNNGRKVHRGAKAPGCPVRVGDDGVWHIQDYATARRFLRHNDTRQAGLGIENALRHQHRMRLPMLYRDGPEHREQRRQTARYFTPKRVESAYRELMHRLADQQCEVLRRRGAADLSALSFQLAVAVAAEVVGLTDSAPGMPQRLDRFFAIPDPDARGLSAVRQKAFNNFVLLSFLWRDVRPAVAARRRHRRDDLISHLIDQGCSLPEILGECVTFAAAGMVTTREFITVAAWHLLTDETLRAQYTGGDQAARVAVLHEILRLEPVVGDLLRWTTADVTVGDVAIPSGARVEVAVAAANLDPAEAGDQPRAVCPGRPVGPGLSFGDGAHKCPGAHIAIQETDIFLSRLFAMPGLRMIREPTVTIRPDIASYEIKGLILAV